VVYHLNAAGLGPTLVGGALRRSRFRPLPNGVASASAYTMVQARTPHRELAEDGANRERVITLAATRLAALRTSPLWQQ
jgi:hypothetical protein